MEILVAFGFILVIFPLWRIVMVFSDLKPLVDAAVTVYNGLKAEIADLTAKNANLTEQLAAATANAVPTADIDALGSAIQQIK